MLKPRQTLANYEWKSYWNMWSDYEESDSNKAIIPNQETEGLNICRGGRCTTYICIKYEGDIICALTRTG